MSKPVRIVTLLIVSALIPFALINLYIAITHGRAAQNLAVHRILVLLIPCSGAIFAFWLPFELSARIIIATLLALVLYDLTQGYGFWAACALYDSCP